VHLERTRKRFRIGILAALVVGIVLVIYASHRGGAAFPSPEACLDAYRDACKDGNWSRYLSCLGEPLRSERQLAATVETLHQEMEGIKSWTRLDPVVQNTTAYADVDQVRLSGTCRIRFHLQRAGPGWLIVGIDLPLEIPTPIRFGTHVGEGSD
jgi:hypothetical protein